MKYKFERAKEDNDPNRCQGVGANGQCPFLAVEGTKNCARHGGARMASSQRASSERLYKLAQWQGKLNAQASHPQIKSLRDELGILRMTLESKLDACKDEQQLLMASGHIVEMVREIAKTAKICHALEMSLGVVLDKTQAQAWVQEIGEILDRYIDDADVLQMISEDMLASLDKRTNIQQ